MCESVKCAGVRVIVESVKVVRRKGGGGVGA